MPRYALRNKKKIQEAKGNELLERIVKSLDEYFTEDRDSVDLNDSGEKYPILLINDADHTVNMVAFYVIDITYDVYRLAFKEFIG